MKIQKTLKWIVVASSAAIIVGCGKPGGGDAGQAAQTTGSTGATTTGSTVKTIQDRIAADAELKGADIKVKESAGSISLEGTVSSTAQKDKVEQIVYAVEKDMKQQPGVMDNLLVKEGGSGAKGNGGN